MIETFSRSRTPAQHLMHEFTRDLSVCTEGELKERWTGAQATAVNDILERAGSSFDSQVTGHNPIYFLAEEVFFDDQRGNTRFLYEPLHKDVYAAHALEYITGEHMDAGMLLLASRSTYKSTFQHGATPLWAVLRKYRLEGKFARAALIHHKDVIAWKNLDRIRQRLAFHPWFKQIWPECSAPIKDLGSTKAVLLPNAPKGLGAAEATFEAAGLGGSLTGSHYDFIFFSDLVIEAHRFSEQLRQETAEKHASMIYLLDDVTDKRLYDGTIYHPHDLWATFLNAKDERGRPMYRCVVRPGGYNEAMEMIASGVPREAFLPGGQHAHVLAHPYKWSLDAMERNRRTIMAEMGTDDFFHAQIDLRIKTSRTIVTSLDDIRVVEPEQISRNAINAVLIDPAWKGTENSGRGDDAAIEVWSFQRRGDMVIRTFRDGVISNEMSQSEGLAATFGLAKRYGCVYAVPEETAGSGISKTLEDNRAKYGHWFEVVNLKDTYSRVPGKKAARIVNFVGEAQDGQIEISTECSAPMRTAFEHQYENFTGPGSLRKDDALDCASFTCDSGVREGITPARGVAEPEMHDRISWMFRKIERGRPPVSRYCG